MSSWDHANQLASHIAAGGDGEFMKELRLLVLPFVFKVRNDFHFHDVPAREIEDTLVDQAVHDAILRSMRWGRPFMFFLRNSARDAFRQHRKMSRQVLLEDLGQCLGSGAACDDVSDERVNLVMGALREQRVFCQQVLGLWARGSTIKAIARHLGVTEKECRLEKIRNVRRIRTAIRHKTGSKAVTTRDRP